MSTPRRDSGCACSHTQPRRTDGRQPSKIAVVTGGGSGIGAAVALALAGDGWVVVLAGRRPQALASVAERGAGLPGGA